MHGYLSLQYGDYSTGEHRGQFDNTGEHRGQANLINFGILPCIFENPNDYDSIDEHDELEFTNLDNLQPNSKITVTNKTKNNTFTVLLPYNEEQINMLQKGGLLNTLK